MSNSPSLSPQLEAQIKLLIDESIAQFKDELIAYIDNKYQESASKAPAQEEVVEPLTLNMVMLQIAAIFEKFSHYDEIYRTYGIEADTFQDECNDAIDMMKFQIEQFESQLREFQNRLLIEESGGDSAIKHDNDISQEFKSFSKEVQETLSQFDQYFDAQSQLLDEIPVQVDELKAELKGLQEQLSGKQSKSESLIKLQETKQELLSKIKRAVASLNEQLPLVVDKQIAKRNPD
ncbi:hypothetical protein SAMN02745127_02753 [Oceanospirillum multiglobuliferum]|uniref:Uncharacterized protein n=1 Tax=Oceanospirillum multiglobuliferum TaxID=64969 RepID=A0A1T4S4V9_9GAMM|nr:hypothetical protein [Oceanospirillum multiglobuliferum]OPX54441.1 hypothetical protein BTE48_14075 [Oceanospirillum multiglobuliferum]SKA23263.1 hypothetical protein SAMN02745127_02753 [Oceanospirillum multiglobuliferum]